MTLAAPASWKKSAMVPKSDRRNHPAHPWTKEKQENATVRSLFVSHEDGRFGFRC
jgi:hypothetical protein